MNWDEIRKEFSALEHTTWLNSATYGQMPRAGRAAMIEHLDRRDQLACRDFLSWFDDMDAVRADAGRLVGCGEDDIAFADNAAQVLSFFLGSFDWQEGDRVLTLRNEFPNQFYYGKWLGSKGVELLEMDRIEEIPERTRAIVLSTASYVNGYLPDVARIAKLAHEHGVLLYADGTQSVGALRFDVATVQPDVFAVNSYKWLLGPNGATFYYVSPALRERIEPTVIGWRSDRNWRKVDSLSTAAPDFSDRAERYEGGMLNFPSLYAMGASIRMMLEIGPAVIERRVLELASKTEAILRHHGAEIRNPGSHIVAGHWPDRDASALNRALAEQGIFTSARHGNLRVSAHFYNNEADLDRFDQTLGVVCSR